MKWEKVGFKRKKFYDAFAWIEGTTEEKMVYNALAIRQIPFYFQYPVPDISFTPEVEGWRADFYLPDYNIILEVYGSFWHMLPGRVETDAWRIAVLEAAGYRVILWWDFEINRDINALFAAMSEFNPPIFKGPPYPTTYAMPKSGAETAKAFALKRPRKMRMKEISKAWERVG